MTEYEHARQAYAAYGVDTEAAISELKDIPVSIHCWQGDDVVGLDGGGAARKGLRGRRTRPAHTGQPVFWALAREYTTAFQTWPSGHSHQTFLRLPVVTF